MIDLGASNYMIRGRRTAHREARQSIAHNRSEVCFLVYFLGVAPSMVAVTGGLPPKIDSFEDKP
jgi:hypothetical protein